MTRTQARGSRATWTAGLAVALGAGVATAHGLYQVAAASGVPNAVAWLYPLITDGLALVAYAATARLHSTGRRYAAVVVIGAAGLSGLAQAVFLAGGITARAAAPVGLRFGVGFWPAAAAAIAAHLLHLISTGDNGDDPAEATAGTVVGVENRHANHSAPDPAVEPGPVSNVAASNRPSNPSNQPVSNPAVQPRTTTARTAPPVQPEPDPQLYDPAAGLNTEPPATGRQTATDRARAAAETHRDRTGALPTVTELTRLADVARGTAGTALKTLRDERPLLHLVNQPAPKGTHQ